MGTHMHRPDVEEAMAGKNIYLRLCKQFLSRLCQPFYLPIQWLSFSSIVESALT